MNSLILVASCLPFITGCASAQTVKANRELTLQCDDPAFTGRVTAGYLELHGVVETPSAGWKAEMVESRVSDDQNVYVFDLLAPNMSAAVMSRLPITVLDQRVPQNIPRVEIVFRNRLKPFGITEPIGRTVACDPAP